MPLRIETAIWDPWNARGKLELGPVFVSRPGKACTQTRDHTLPGRSPLHKAHKTALVCAGEKCLRHSGGPDFTVHD